MKGAKITGLWKNKSKKNNSYLAGNIGLARVLVLPNDFKEKETDPDYNMWIVPREKKENGTEKQEVEEDIEF